MIFAHIMKPNAPDDEYENKDVHIDQNGVTRRGRCGVIWVGGGPTTQSPDGDSGHGDMGCHLAGGERAWLCHSAWEHLGILPEELEEVSGVREVWESLLRQLPPRPGPDKQKKMDGWMDHQTQMQRRHKYRKRLRGVK